jgi:malonyl CoA-acyl carrier protein transacylase
MNQTEVTQPLLLFSHYLHFQQNHAHSPTPDDFMIGHSLGEFSALVNAKSLSFEDGLKLVHQRGSLMKKHTTSPHGMLIVKYKP